MQDTFRKEYKPLSDDQKEQIKIIKAVAEETEKLFNLATTESNGREMAVAKTHLETAIMWAIKGVTK